MEISHEEEGIEINLAFRNSDYFRNLLKVKIAWDQIMKCLKEINDSSKDSKS